MKPVPWSGAALVYMTPRADLAYTVDTSDVSVPGVAIVTRWVASGTPREWRFDQSFGMPRQAVWALWEHLAKIGWFE